MNFTFLSQIVSRVVPLPETMETRTYAINRAKWEAAEEYCLDRGYKFRIITEDHLKA